LRVGRKKQGSLIIAYFIDRAPAFGRVCNV